MNMIITTERTKAGYFLDVLLTALGWLAFVLLFLGGIIAILRGEVRGPDTPLISPLMLSSISTVLGYLVLMVVFSVLLLTWAKYNQYRFSGLDRRKAPPPLSNERLRASFSVTDPQIEQMQGGHVNVVEHDQDGRIIAIQALDVMQMATPAAKTAPESTQAPPPPSGGGRSLRWASASYGVGPDGSVLPLRTQVKVADLPPIPLDPAPPADSGQQRRSEPAPAPARAAAAVTPTFITLLSGVDPFQRERGDGGARSGWSEPA